MWLEVHQSAVISLPVVSFPSPPSFHMWWLLQSRAGAIPEQGVRAGGQLIANRRFQVDYDGCRDLSHLRETESLRKTRDKIKVYSS